MAPGGRDRAPPADLRRASAVFIAWMSAVVVAHGFWPAAQGVTSVLAPLTAAFAIVLSAAGAAMVSAVGVDDIVETLRTAGEALFGEPGRLALAWPGPGTSLPDGSGIMAVDAFPEPVAELADGCPKVLAFPVTASTARPSPLAAVLVAFGTAQALAPLYDSVETLAGQAALAIDRVALVDEVRRRANEEYLRTLIQNAADGIMIVSEGGRIRYASPSAGRQLADPGFVDGVRRILGESGLAPGLLVLELTETSLLQDGDRRVPQILAALKDLGVLIALDDFGTGFSSLSYLTDLPVDILKIDKSFISGVTGSHDRAALVEGIIHIADALDMAVIAEGIETPEQHRRLAVTRCAYGQGYRFGRPMPAADVRELLRSAPVIRLPRSG